MPLFYSLFNSLPAGTVWAYDPPLVLKTWRNQLFADYEKKRQRYPLDPAERRFAIAVQGVSQAVDKEGTADRAAPGQGRGKSAHHADRARRARFVMDIEAIAWVCHEANRAYCQSIGDDSQPSWNTAPEWQRQSAINGVKFAVENPGSEVSAQHENWARERRAEGWKYGPVKDPDKKEHPCLLAFADLPFEQRVKDHLFRAIALTLWLRT